jgi:hypothetical protein
MNSVNRLLLIVELLIVVVALPIVVILLLFNRAGLSDTLASVTRGLAAGSDTALSQVLCVGSALLIFVVAVILLFLELRPSSRRLRVKQVTDGQVEVTDDAIIQRLGHSILQIADVIGAHPRVAAAKNNAVDVSVELETSPEVNVPQKTQEVIVVVKQVMEEQMGLQVGKIRVQIDYSHKPKPQTT